MSDALVTGVLTLTGTLVGGTASWLIAWRSDTRANERGERERKHVEAKAQQGIAYGIVQALYDDLAEIRRYDKNVDHDFDTYYVDRWRSTRSLEMMRMVGRLSDERLRGQLIAVLFEMNDLALFAAQFGDPEQRARHRVTTAIALAEAGARGEGVSEVTLAHAQALSAQIDRIDGDPL